MTAFLSGFFPRYVEYEFTAGLEDQLDHVSAGDEDYHKVLQAFWGDFKAAIDAAMDTSITEVLEKINDILEPHVFPPEAEGVDPRQCKHCGGGRLSIRTARSGGAFIGCSNYPECKYTRAFGPPGKVPEDSAIPPGGKLLGTDNGDNIYAMKGRFGPYVQRGDMTAEVPKPPRQGIPEAWPLADIDLAAALKLLALPRLIGPHPADGVNVWANIGRYGPYLKYAETTSHKGGVNANLESLEDVWTIGMNRAVQVLADKQASRGRGRVAKPIRDLGAHPDAGGDMAIYDGKYGPYVKWGKINATLPSGVEIEDVTVEQAVALIAERAAKGGKKKPDTGKEEIGGGLKTYWNVADLSAMYEIPKETERVCIGGGCPQTPASIYKRNEGGAKGGIVVQRRRVLGCGCVYLT